MIRLAASLALFAGAAQASVFELPRGASEVLAKTTASGNYALPLAPYFDGAVDTLRVEGDVARQVWHLPGTFGDAFSVVSPFRQALIDQGYEVLLDCDARACGGFDFRFAIDVAAPPAMYVDLGDYHFLSTRKGSGSGTDYVSLMASRSAKQGYLQITRIGPRDQATRAIATSSKAPAVDAGPLINRLQDNGHAVLEDLAFATGSSSLAEQEFPSLATLAAFLKDNPDQLVTLVGHTDGEGALAGNIALSRKRAASVMARLVDRHGVPGDQLAADGVGYLSPRASNDDDTGRRKNRRVEVILTATR